MATIQGLFAPDGRPKNGVNVSLYSSGASFATNPPVKGTARPASGVLQTVTTGTASGCDGGYRFTGVTPGTYYAGIDYLGTTVWDSYTVQADVAQANVKTTYGAVGDGVTDDTAAFQAALNDTAVGEILIPPGSYSVGNLTISNRTHLKIRGTGGRILWNGTAGVGNQIGFQLAGTVTDLELLGVWANGDSNANNKHCLLWCADGQTLTDIRVVNCYVTNCVRGVRISASSSGTTKNVLIQGNHFLDTIGTATGQGEAIFIDEGSLAAAQVRILGNYFENSRRYDVHVNQAIGMVVAHNTSRDHRLTGNSGTRTPAFRFIRIQDLVCADNVIEGSYDGAIEVVSITGTTTKQVTVARNTIIGAANDPTTSGDITIGTNAPVSDGFPEEILIQGNMIQKSGRANPGIYLYCGKRVRIDENLFQLLAVTAAGTACVTLAGQSETAGTTNYTDDVSCAHNTFYGTLSGGTLFAFSLLSALCTSAAALAFRGNKDGVPSGMFTVGANVTDANVTLDAQSAGGFTFSGTTKFLQQSYGSMLLAGQNLQMTGAGRLTAAGGVGLGTPVVKTADYTVANTDFMLIADTTAGNVTFTLPSAGTAQQLYALKKAPSTNNTMTIARAGSDTIDGGTSLSVGAGTTNSGWLLCSDGVSKWYAIANI